MPTLIRIITALLFFGYSTVNAEESTAYCTDSSPQCIPIGKWDFELAIGLGGRSNPIIGGDTIPLLLIPQISYYGERFFIDNLDIGYTLAESHRHAFSLLVTPAFDSVFFDQRDPGNILESSVISGKSGAGTAGTSDSSPSIITKGRDSINPPKISESEFTTLDDRDFSMLAGIEYSAYFGRHELQLQYLSDATGTHDGEQIKAALTSTYTGHKTQVDITVGLTWKSDEYLTYYYGLSANEAPQRIGAYELDSGTNKMIRFGWQRAINEKWRWQLTLQYEHLDSEISNSPIVEKEYVYTGFIGTVYDF